MLAALTDEMRCKLLQGLIERAFGQLPQRFQHDSAADDLEMRVALILHCT